MPPENTCRRSPETTSPTPASVSMTPSRCGRVDCCVLRPCSSASGSEEDPDLGKPSGPSKTRGRRSPAQGTPEERQRSSCRNLPVISDPALRPRVHRELPTAPKSMRMCVCAPVWMCLGCVHMHPRILSMRSCVHSQGGERVTPCVTSRGVCILGKGRAWGVCVLPSPLG